MQAFRWGALGAWIAIASASAQTFSPEQLADPPVLGPFQPDRSNDSPVVGFDGQVYWVIWDDEWSGLLQVSGIRIAPGGTVLDTTELRLDPSGGLQTAPAIACIQGTCLVAWEDYRWGDADLRAVRLSSSGQVLDRPSLLVNGDPGDQQDPDLTTDGADFLVVWHDQTIHAARVSGGGQLLDSSPVSLGASNGPGRPGASYLAGAYLLTWLDGSSPRLLASRMTPAGAVLDGAPFVVVANAAGVSRPRTDGTEWWIPWTDSSLNGLLTRVETDAGVLDPTGISVTPKLDPPGPALGFDGTLFWLAWEDFVGSAVFAARVATDGGSLDPTPVLLSSASVQLPPRIGCRPAECLAAWPSYASPGTEIDGAFVSPDGGATSAQTLTPAITAASGETQAAIACATDTCLVAWDDSAPGVGSTLHAVRVAADGKPLDSTPLVFSSSLSSLTVAAQPAEFLVAWTESGAQDFVRAVRVGLDGGTLDATPIVLETNSNEMLGVVAAPLGKDFAVAWAEEATTDQVLWRTVSAGGSLGGGPWVASTFASAQHAPALATSGARTLLAWIDTRTANEAVFGNFIFPDGGASNPAGFEIGPDMLSVFNNLFWAPAIAAGPNDFLVAWAELPDAGGGPANGLDLHAARVDFDGGALDSTPWTITSAPGNQMQPAAVYDGRGFLVAWSDDQAGLVNVEASLFDPSGAPLGPGLHVSPAGDALAPALARGGSGQTLLAYQRFIADGGILNTRIVTRAWIDPVLTDGGSADAGVDAGADAGQPPDGGGAARPGSYHVGCALGLGPAPILLTLLLVFIRKRYGPTTPCPPSRSESPSTR